MTRMPVTFQERVVAPVGGALRPAAAAFTTGDVLRVIKQRIFQILFVWLVVVGATAVATYLLMRYAPKYTAVARVLVESPKPQAPMTLGEAPLTPDVQQRVLLDQAMIVKSDIVLQEALRDSQVMATSWFNSYGPEEGDKRLLDLQEDLVVVPIERTSFLSISMACKNPDDPHRIVNAIVDKYIARADVLSRAQYSEQLRDYKQQRDELQNAINSIQQRKSTIVKGLAIPGATHGVNAVAEALRALTAEYTRLQADTIAYRAVWESLRGAQGRNMPISPQMRMMIESDPLIATLKQNLVQLEHSRQIAAQTYGDRHRQVRELDAQIEAVRQKLEKETADKEEQVRQYEMDQAEMAYLNATDALSELMEKLQEQEARQRDLDDDLAEYEMLDAQQKQYETSLAQMDEFVRALQIITQQERTIRVTRAQDATRPLERSSPSWALNMSLGTIGGLLIALLLAVGLEVADTSVRTPSDIVRHVNVPILGTVPDTDDEEVAIDKVETAAHTAPRSMIAEAFRAIRTNLLLSAPAERQRTVLVTSPRPEDGKTTVAANLSISIAQSGRRVLLVDTNFRRPSVHTIFAGGPRGLSNILVGQARLEELVHHTPLPNLDVLPAGPTPPNPAELLGSSYMRDLITQAVERYDQVIFDGPPALLVTDALVLGGMVDGVILVCRAKANSRGVAQRARLQLERVNAHLFGAVLNAAQVRRGGYFREQFRTFYEYQPELPGEMAAALPADQDKPGTS